MLSRGGFGGNSYGGGYGGGGGGYGGGYGGGGGDRMSHLGAGLQKQDWGKSSLSMVSPYFGFEFFFSLDPLGST